MSSKKVLLPCILKQRRSTKKANFQKRLTTGIPWILDNCSVTVINFALRIGQ